MVKKTQAYQLPAPYPIGHGTEDLSRVWYTSDRVNGKLLLKPQQYDRDHRIETLYVRDVPNFTLLPFGADVRSNLNPLGGWGREGAAWAAVQSAAYARLIGKLRSGSAALGVTLGSFKQSQSMIIDRSQKLADFFHKQELKLRKRNSKTPWVDFAKARASDVLEGEFGWVPLVQDIHAAARTACYYAPVKWVRSAHRVTISDRQFTPNAPWSYSRDVVEVGQARGVYSCVATVTNENLWLANRLGLINPATVALDLVPWSWVVGMFVNIQSIVASFTDTMGLTLTDVSFTRRFDITRTEWIKGYGLDPAYTGSNMQQQKWVGHYRQVLGNTLPRPTLQFRVPELNWQLAVTAAALMVQKVHALDRTARTLGRALNPLERVPPPKRGIRNNRV